MRPRLSLCLLSLTVVLSVGACQTFVRNGKGPVTLAPRVMAHFEKYKNRERPGYFALANDGKSGFYSYCDISWTVGCVDDGGDRALTGCDKYAKNRGVKCSLFASDLQIIWDGPVTYPGDAPAVYSPPKPVFFPPQK